jgi:hypothetical protein
MFEMIFSNTVDIEQASIVRQHLDILDQCVKNLKILFLKHKAFQNIIELYVNHFSTN